MTAAGYTTGPTQWSLFILTHTILKDLKLKFFQIGEEQRCEGHRKGGSCCLGIWERQEKRTGPAVPAVTAQTPQAPGHGLVPLWGLSKPGGSPWRSPVVQPTLQGCGFHAIRGQKRKLCGGPRPPELAATRTANCRDDSEQTSVPGGFALRAGRAEFVGRKIRYRGCQ